MLSINISELIWTIINFFLLYFLLKHFLYDPVVRFLDAREARVNAAQAKEDAARAEREESARQIEEEKSLRREEARGIVDASHAKDREESLAAQSKARAEGEKSLESAGEQIRAKGERARAALDAETDELAAMLAERLLAEGKNEP